MKTMTWLNLFILAAAIVIIVYCVGSIQCRYQSKAVASNNVFTAFISTPWTQTSQSDFQAGVLTNTQVSSSGTVTLSLLRTSGTAASQVLDTGRPGTVVDMFSWVETTSSNNDITFEIRASDSVFQKGNNTLDWTPLGGTSPVSNGLAKGRYIQWRSTLTRDFFLGTSPSLQSIDLWYH